MALDTDTRTGYDGRELPLDLSDGDKLLLHHQFGSTAVEFVEFTGEVALPRKGGAVVRYAFPAPGFLGGALNTAVAGELSLAD